MYFKHCKWSSKTIQTRILHKFTRSWYKCRWILRYVHTQDTKEMHSEYLLHKR